MSGFSTVKAGGFGERIRSEATLSAKGKKERKTDRACPEKGDEEERLAENGHTFPLGFFLDVVNNLTAPAFL